MFRDRDGDLSDNGLYAAIWFLIACLLCGVLFKGCEANGREVEIRAMKEEGERNARAFEVRECIAKNGTMYGDQCVIVCGAGK